MNDHTNTRGIVLFAYNTDEVDYLHAAQITAERAARFLKLPSTVITNQASLDKTRAQLDEFDQVIITPPVENNYLNRKLWLNKGRHQAYDLSPYHDTILLDVDYVINSTKLLQLFEIDNDILVHDTTMSLMRSNESEQLGTSKFEILWATVIRFRKSERAQQLFQMLKMVQENYNYYTHLFHYHDYIYRNDYALTIALKTINGQLYKPEDFIKFPLVHVPDYVNVEQVSDTEYIIEHKDKVLRKHDYIKVTDFDFHLMHKKNFFKLFCQ